MITHSSSINDKIAVFRSLFRGREDIYPRRFENNKTQKSGYSPACGNEWVRGVCEKPRIKCLDCQFSRFLPITDEVIQWHLSGVDKNGRDFVMGIYPMMLDETCFFLAADFDKDNWQADALAFLKTCHRMNLPAALERSRSGKGAHVWLFFSEAINQIKEIPENEKRILLATGKFIGEGFDDARLDTLFLTLPVSWRGTIAQYVGRLHRLHHLKKEVQVYDYADLNVPMLERMFNRRCRAYEAVGYKIFLPASASPGWPTDIPLPVDPKWKADYAATVRRLIRDGVDRPLAKLFTQIAVPPIVEAFLHHRLETLPTTTGRFHLNVELSIPFNGLGRMEVDLLCADAHIAIEIDGEQHLADATAYRRDRRKDVLLQENGYMVLRFLAKDVSKHLDEVLDSILRAMARSDSRKKSIG